MPIAGVNRRNCAPSMVLVEVCTIFGVCGWNSALLLGSVGGILLHHVSDRNSNPKAD